jgi:hypothetical protein
MVCLPLGLHIYVSKIVGSNSARFGTLNTADLLFKSFKCILCFNTLNTFEKTTQSLKVCPDRGELCLMPVFVRNPILRAPSERVYPQFCAS